MRTSGDEMGEGFLLPVDTENNPTSRRQFLRAACAPMLLSILGVSMASCSNSTEPDDDGGGGGGGGVSDGVTINGNTVTLDLTKNVPAPLASPGGFLRISAASIIAANVGGTIRAFSSVCPHQGNTVSQFNGTVFTCPTHGSQFNAQGQVVNGPATRPLTEYAATKSGNIVTITKA